MCRIHALAALMPRQVLALTPDLHVAGMNLGLDLGSCRQRRRIEGCDSAFLWPPARLIAQPVPPPWAIAVVCKARESPRLASCLCQRSLDHLTDRIQQELIVRCHARLRSLIGNQGAHFDGIWLVFLQPIRGE